MRAFGRLSLISLLFTLILWGAFSWPLPKYFSGGIPSSAHNVEQGQVRRMIPGDHLQLHYFYWIFSDMLTGGTPMWHNLYEFNTGDDAARHQVGNYNMPISFLYLAASRIGGPAFGWNMTGLITLWGTLLAMWLLLRRLTRENLVSLLCAMLSISLPYRWMTLLGGSPTGFAMLWVPFMFLGLDMAGRDDSFKGGLLASAALLLSYWNDPHTFFFCVLFIPVGYLSGFVRRETYPWSTPSGWVKILYGVLPVTVAVLGLIGIGLVVKEATFDSTNMAQGREIHEVMLFSPRLRGVLAWRANQTDDQIFIGYALLMLFAGHIFGFVYALSRRLRSGKALFQHGMLMCLFYASILVIALLAMGPRSPFDAVLFRAARRLLPGFSMIRQTGKIYALMPVFIALASALAAKSFLIVAARWKSRILPVSLVAVFVLTVMFEHHRVIRPTVSLVDLHQPAYGAVARDAQEDPDIPHPHALVLPIWPGDSHWASLYQHYVSLYRIRMINGYSPIVSQAYREEVFERFVSANGGILDDDQLDDLLRRDIHYVIFHEDAYPEQLSAFPVGFALRRLLSHPRLALLEQGGSVRSFRILPKPRPDGEHLPFPDGPYFPSSRWNASNGILEGGEWLSDDSALGGHFARMSAGATFALRHPFNHMYAPTPHLWLRIRGQGRAHFERVADETDPLIKDVDSPEWDWVQVPLPTDRQELHFRAEVMEGVLDLDMLTLVGGDWNPPAPGGSLFLPAGLFFRAGYTNAEDGSVTLRSEYDPASVVFFGPRLPFHQGEYRITFQFTSDAPSGTDLGSFVVTDGNTVTSSVSVVQGEEAYMLYRHDWNLPLSLKFTFSRAANLRVQGIEFHHLRP